MTRQQYIELLEARLKRIDSADRFHPRYIEGALDFVWQNLAFEAMGKLGTDPFFYTKQYTPVTVSQDSNGRYYSDLPDVIIHLPRVSSGVVRISQLAGTDMDFAPVSERDFVMMRSQEVFAISNTIYYYVTKDDINYGDNMTTSIASSGVRIDMVIPFRSYDLDEDIPIPSGKAQEFINLALQFLGATPPVDLVNKNSEG
jgi:hypothetical protein